MSRVYNKLKTVLLINPGSISYPRQADHRPTYIMMCVNDNGEAAFELKYV